MKSSYATAFRGAPGCPGGILTRRDFLRGLGAAAVLPSLSAVAGADSGALDGALPPRAPVGIALCNRYEMETVRRALGDLFDELGEVRRLVRRQHVTVKTNLVNTSAEDVAGVPLGLTVITHPVVAMAVGSLLTSYGARTVTFCDQLPFRSPDREAFSGYGYDLRLFNQAMDGRARFHNTRNREPHRGYASVRVPGGGELATAWEVNRGYADTDVLVSLAKLKSHVSGGITGGLKNLFGIPPSSLYGEDLGEEPDENAIGYRGTTMHSCVRQPLTSFTTFTGRSVEGDHGYNVPRFIVDLASAFPIQLTVIDGISTIQAAEGWWNGSMISITRPGLLLAGRNAVCTDSIAAGVMGFDPNAPDHAQPFVNGTNHLALARRRGLGENRLERIEVAGVPLERARFGFQPTFQRQQPGG
jgi:uncharacterized protein (DUF362 family)